MLLVRLRRFDHRPRKEETEIPKTERPTKVKFSEDHEVKVVSPLPDAEFRPSSPASSVNSLLSSGATTPNSDSDPTSQVAKALSSRLSFWTRLSRRQSAQPEVDTEDETPQQLKHDDQDDPAQEPADVMQDILNSNSPTPSTAEERQSELDAKVLKECIKQFTKGCMFFAYNFGELLYANYPSEVCNRWFLPFLSGI